MESALNGISKVLTQAVAGGVNRYSDTDTIVDGLRHCATCGKPKQMRIDMFDKEQIVPIMCDCAKAAYDKQVAEEKQKKKDRYIEQMRRDAITDAEYLQWTMGNDDGENKKISDLCNRYINNWKEMQKENVGLILHGDVGTGKTFYACAIANAILDMGGTALITSLPKLIQSMQGFDGESARILRRIQNVDLLVIDDLGVERDSAYSLERVYEIIDTRYRSGKPLIVTTNLSKKRIEQPEDIKYKRIYDRINEMCITVEVKGKGRRAQNGKKKADIARNMLYGSGNGTHGA